SQDDFVPAVKEFRNWKEKVALQKKAEFLRNAEKFKKHYEELCNEERICWKEICAFEKKMEVWSSKSASAPVPTPSAKVSLNRTPDNDLPREVVDLEKFLLQTGGVFGGWDQVDHDSFLKVWKKHSGRPDYREEALVYLPNKTEEELRLHEDWYQKLLSLQEKKKEAIVRWKAEQQKRKETKQQQHVKEEDAKKHESAELKEVQRCRMEEKRRDVAARLQAWKTRRNMQLAQEHERRLKEQIQVKRQAKEERQKQLEAKMAVQAHIQQKKELEDLLTREKESVERAEMEKKKRFAAKEIKRFQERIEGHVSRDPTRLSRLTKGWEERTKKIGPTGGRPVLQMFHRAVPTWRQDL
ncbi:hypothetical protein Z043_104523, partial [Scleropages formosus]